MYQPASNKPAQIIGLDILRFVAAFAVLCFHYLYLTGMEGHTPYRLTHGAVSFPFVGDYAKLGWMGVEVFFLISGFVISLSASGRTAGKFFESRFLRLLPSAFICATLTLIAAFLVHDGAIAEIVKRYIRSIFFIPTGIYIDGSYWTLGIEVMFYASIWVLLLFRKWTYFYGLVVALSIGSLSYNLLSFYVPEYWTLDGRITDLLLLRHGCEFALGGMIYLFFIEKMRARKLAVPAILALLASCYEIAVQYFNHAHSIWNNSEFVWAMLIWTMSLAAFIIFVSFNMQIAHVVSDKVAKIIRRIGMMTYPLYLLHAVIGSALLYQFVRLGIEKYAALGLVIVAILAMTYVVSEIEPFLGRFCKKILSALLDGMRQVTAGLVASKA